ncbi:MAG: M48 family metalloprotease [Candidatus Heimdallarchaeota archaeon]|nr:MAG: M48 family metalloprotease [Candidatus Heimdallarchaeota archaeon]
MPKNLYLRSFAILTFLWGIVFVIGMVLAYLISISGAFAGYEYLIIVFPVIIAFIILGIQFLISPWIMDLCISWVYDATKYPVEELPANIRDFLYQQMELHNFSLKWVAIIHDNNPNAFTYGHTKKRARMAITEGILNYLDEDEQLAVVAHECGHIVHRDFIFMTIAAAIPLICYVFYQGLWTFARVSTTSDDDAAKVGLAAGVVAIGAWIAYYISHFFVLLLSRIREYYADGFSAEATGDPGALSRSLVKIAYGMIKADAEVSAKVSDKGATATERKQAARQGAFMTGMSSLGIFDVTGAKNLAMSAYGRGMELNDEAVAQAAQWDLSNPWGGFLELFSTHPLPAKRILSLNKMQEEQGFEPEFPGMGKVKLPESLWDEFLVDLFLAYVAPLLFFILPLIGYLLVWFVGNGTYDPLIGAGVGLLLFALIWKWRRNEKYPKIRDSDPTVTVVHCLTDMTKNSYYEVSPLRGKKAVFEGRVVGRGVPGYFLSEDLVIQDETGILTLDYSPLLSCMSCFFALFQVPGLQGRMVKAYGWYHRTPSPVLSIWKIVTEDGQVFKNRWSGANWLFMWIVILIGLFVLATGLAASFVPI